MSASDDNISQVAPSDPLPDRSSLSTREFRGLAFVEFSTVLVVALVVLFMTVQMALLGEAALALGQINYQGARYAAAHPDCDLNSCANGEQSIRSLILALGPSAITKANGKYLAISV